ncbi:hypothetical protein [Mesorhizobium sp. B2-8-9]|uniref:hypothetical protein n=1 Tax=Mesorhizobium sp. B2-8-9 TaxID=2589899 RepID=UPI001125E1B4|nr:hypothetical protein [Mesorhizobium sp. B2-8-9]TPI86422.1 hypothetical protein FJ423_00945 [Mesorhizobium sp. B2-8-9]
MSAWGTSFQICGVNVVPLVATQGFSGKIDPSSKLEDIQILNTGEGADVRRARATLLPFVGKPYSELLAFLNEMCVMPVDKKTEVFVVTGDGQRYVGTLEQAKVEIEQTVAAAVRRGSGLIITDASPELHDFLIDLNRHYPPNVTFGR